MLDLDLIKMRFAAGQGYNTPGLLWLQGDMLSNCARNMQGPYSQ